MNAASKIGILRAKVIALAVHDLERATRFYRDTLGLAPCAGIEPEIGFQLGETILMLKPAADWYGQPGPQLHPRLTLEVVNALETEAALRKLGVALTDPVQLYDGHPVGAFLDSEGNKLWFCSPP